MTLSVPGRRWCGRRRGVLAAALLVGALLVPTQAAHAEGCWASLNIKAWLLPCKKNDTRGQKRLRQQTGMLVVKSVALAMEIQFMKTEIRAQRAHIKTLKDYEALLNRLSGDQMMSPLPSLQYVYEQAPTLAWAREGQNARRMIRGRTPSGVADLIQTDVRARAERVFATWEERGRVEKDFGLGVLRAGQTQAEASVRQDEVVNLAIVMQEQVGVVQRNRRAAAPAAANVREAANRLSGRYDGAIDPGGESEAAITQVGGRATAGRAKGQELRRERLRQTLESMQALQRARAQLEQDYRTVRP